MSWFDLVLAGVLPAIGTGMGSAIGVWLAQRGVLKHLEKIEAKVKGRSRK